MVLEAVLYFFLGLLSAALLALMIAPAIWNRAVALTKKRIESSVPLTLNEVQADKDQLRAEFAMSTRRLEMSIEELKEKAASQVIEINRKRDELNKLTSDSKERLQSIEGLEKQASALRQELADRGQEMEALNQAHERVSRNLEEKTLMLEEAGQKLSNSQEQLAAQRIELVARDAKIDSLEHAVSTVDLDDDSLRSELTKTKRALTMTRNKLDAEIQKNKDLEAKKNTLDKQHKTAVLKVESRERDLHQARTTASLDDAQSTELTRQLIDEKAKTVELEAKIAQNALQMEALLGDASNENVESAMRSVKDVLSKQSLELDEIKAERDKLIKDVAAFERSKTGDWATDRRDNAILRERINDMAAQVTALTASLDGKNSPIDKIISDAREVSKPRSNAMASISNGKAADKTSLSLAERIVAIRDSASSVDG